MQLNITTDYAIRMLWCLGEMDVKKSGPTIAEEVRIPPKYILKIAMKLREAGMIGSSSGAQGGYYLLKPLDKISWLAVVRIMEPSLMINRCMEPDEYCSQGAARECAFRRFYQAMQKEIENKWASLSLADILATYGGYAECENIVKMGGIEELCRKEVQRQGSVRVKGGKNRGNQRIRGSERNCSLC